MVHSSGERRLPMALWQVEMHGMYNLNVTTFKSSAKANLRTCWVPTKSRRHISARTRASSGTSPGALHCHAPSAWRFSRTT